MQNRIGDKENKKVYLIWSILAVLSLATLILPFAGYSYNKTTYQLAGFDFLLGKKIMGGTAYIAPVKFMWLAVMMPVAVLVVVLLKSRISSKLCGRLILAFGFVQVFCCGLFLLTASSTLSAVKKPKIEYGLYMLMFLGILIVVSAVYILYQLKVLCALDFMVLPGLLYLLINNYLPLIGISIAFRKIDFVKGIWNSEWVGFENFEFLFRSKDAFVITRNTLLYNAAFIIIGNTMGIITGICLSEIFSKRLQKIHQTLILLPQLISMVIVAYIVYGFLSYESGFVNKTLLSEAINFYGEKRYWPFILLFVNTWKGLGYSSTIYLSSIVGIDRNLYEAARIDGCTKFGAIKNITIPMLKPTVYTLVLLQVGRIFYSDFGLFYQVPMNSGALYTATNTIDTYVYRAMMKLNNISMASAASAYQAIVGFVIVLTFNLIVRKVNKENALF